MSSMKFNAVLEKIIKFANYFSLFISFLLFFVYSILILERFGNLTIVLLLALILIFLLRIKVNNFLMLFICIFISLFWCVIYLKYVYVILKPYTFTSLCLLFYYFYFCCYLFLGERSRYFKFLLSVYLNVLISFSIGITFLTVKFFNVIVDREDFISMLLFYFGFLFGLNMLIYIWDGISKKDKKRIKFVFKISYIYISWHILFFSVTD